MSPLTQKLSTPIFAKAIRFVILALFLVVFGLSSAFAQTTVTNAAKRATTKAATTTDEQVAFTATGTASITGVTHLPGGLTQVNFTTSGKATHLGDFTGPLTRIQDNQGTFGSTAVIVGANGKDSIFFSVSGQFDRSKDKCIATSTGTYIVTGGGGAFANATGSGTIETTIDTCAGTASGTYTGTISKPNLN